MAKVVHVVTNVDHFADSDEPTGLWLSELVHVWDQLAEQGIEQVIASPAGGTSPIEPKSLLPVVADKATRTKHEDPEFMALLENTAKVEDIDWHDVDAVYLAGGHGAMFDFPGCVPLQHLVRDVYANGRLVASVCHGYAGLIGVTMDDSQPFLTGKAVTGFSWPEEIAAGVASKVPFNLEAKVKELGAEYTKALLPMTAHVVQDGRLISGQNPASAKGVGERLTNCVRVRNGN